MELDVGLGIGRHVGHRQLHGLATLGDLRDVIERGAHGGKACRWRLDQLAHLDQVSQNVIVETIEGMPMQNIGIEYVPVAALSNPSSKPLPGFNQSFGAQNLDGFAERGSTRAVQRHEIGFTWQNATWLIDTAHNALPSP